MSSNKKHTDEFITKIFKLSRERGLTARQIAEVVSPEYRNYNGVDMSRNAVIGILNRYEGRFTHMGKKEVKRVSFFKIAEQLEQARQSMKDKDKYKVRKCLSCRKEKLLHKVMFVCDNCKSRASYSSYIEDHSVSL
jgi:hypothetical protein|tara:strand:+ start:268 stop:675 length:408 start_codon:yes stop_codon:yes gene_type:complete